MTAAPRSLARDDDGFTLTELVVATAILSIILLAVGGMMFSTTITQRSVTAMSQSASTAQTAADGIRVQLRNATEFELFPRGSADQLLVARVLGTGSSAAPRCHGWYYADTERQLRTASWPETGSTALPTSAAGVSGWTLLLDGVTPRSGAEVFGTPTGTTIPVAFEVESDDRNAPTAIEFTAARAAGQGGGTTCWD